MSSVPRILVLIGSGETADPMARVQRTIAQRASGGPEKSSEVRGVIIDTPYRFQENAPELSAGLLDHFTRRIGLRAELATIAGDGDPVERAAALELVKAAPFVFSGPGSPSYALRQWRDSGLPELLRIKLEEGGVLVFASAAALTLGRLTIPVYEIYKGGADPYWLPGLDVLGALGIDAAVVPHFDNRDGQGHDTRFCFLGERRLRALEQAAPSTYILGIDEHSALVLDLDTERASVHGRGNVTIRDGGTATVFTNGTQFPLAELRRASGPRGPAAPDSVAPAHEAVLARRLVSLERSMMEQGRRAEMVEPLIATLLEVRRRARSSGNYELADLIRERLAALGFELTDTADGSTGYRLPG